MRDRALGTVAELVRSKNAGPFWITLDVFLANDAHYRRVSAPDVLNEATIAHLYQVPAGQIRIFRLPSLRAIKISFPAPRRKAASPTATCTQASSTSLWRRCSSRPNHDLTTQRVLRRGSATLRVAARDHV
jgi:hypothetical protein